MHTSEACTNKYRDRGTPAHTDIQNSHAYRILTCTQQHKHLHMDTQVHAPSHPKKFIVVQTDVGRCTHSAPIDVQMVTQTHACKQQWMNTEACTYDIEGPNTDKGAYRQECAGTHRLTVRHTHMLYAHRRVDMQRAT